MSDKEASMGHLSPIPAVAEIRFSRGEVDNLVPTKRGNRLAERHGFYVTKLAPSEETEIQETAQDIRELVAPALDSAALEPLIQGLAGKLWRRQRAYADLIENGIVRVAKPPRSCPTSRRLSGTSEPISKRSR